MSNGDDVLDNWEELDDAGLSNTLEKIKAERNTSASDNNFYSNLTSSTNTKPGYSTTAAAATAMKLLQRTPPQGIKAADPADTISDPKSPLNDVADSFQSVKMVLHKSDDDYQSANYTQPINTQTVKILRRPTQSQEPRNNGIKPRQPIKTLQQREQEYAEARLRILGSAKNPEDDAAVMNLNAQIAAATISAIPATIASVPTSVTAKMNIAPKVTQSGPNLYNNYYYQPPLQQHQQQQQQFFYHQQPQSPAFNNRLLTMLPTTLPHPLYQHQQQQQPANHLSWSPIVGGTVSSPTLRQQQQESILRMPRGPDGSTGFQMRR